jgi:hypothetical protein
MSGGPDVADRRVLLVGIEVRRGSDQQGADLVEKRGRAGAEGRRPVSP